MSIFLRKLNIAHNLFCKYTYKKENHQIFSKDIFQNISTQKEKKGKNLIATVAMRCIHCYPRGCPNVNETVNETVKISKSEACVFNLIQNDNAITYQTLMQVTKLSRATIARIIKKLQDKGFIHRIGSDKNGIWEISNK